jgi:hypothetical protein
VVRRLRGEGNAPNEGEDEGDSADDSLNLEGGEAGTGLLEDNGAVDVCVRMGRVSSSRGGREEMGERTVVVLTSELLEHHELWEKKEVSKSTSTLSEAAMDV